MAAQGQPGPAQDPADLVTRIAAGDPEAEARLVELYSRGLSYLLRRLTGDPSLSEDLHQETFRIVIEKLRRGEVREPEKLAGFLRGTAKNLCRAEHRKAAARPEIEEEAAIAEPPDPAPGPLSRIVQEEERRQLRRVLGELKVDRDRELLYRFHIAEEPKARICAALGISSSQFNVVHFRARQRFKQLLEESARRPATEGGR